MGDTAYAFEKFTSAVRTLATTDGPRREVLREAYRHISPLSESDFPSNSEVLEDYRALTQRLTHASDTTGEGTLVATLRTMSDQEACSLAGLFVDIRSSLDGIVRKMQEDARKVAK